MPVGGRTALHYGYSPPSNIKTVSTSLLTQVIDYPARDMTITVEAGVRLEELARLLEAEQQQLPVDIAQAHRATLGGCVATATSGPRRFAYGTLRDYVIGVTAIDAHGRQFHSGGRVVKNVAGYDLCKLLVGSLGTLAIITQLTLKLKPMHQSLSFVWASFDSFNAIERALENLIGSSTRPIIADVLNPKAARQIIAESRQDFPTVNPVLVIGFEGAAAAVDWQLQVIQSELTKCSPHELSIAEGSNARLILNALTEYQAASDDPLTFQASLIPSATVAFIEQATALEIAVQSHAGNGIVLGHLPDSVITPEQANEVMSPLRQQATAGNGDLVVFNCEDEWKRTLPVFSETGPSWTLMKKLKNQLDPDNLLNPGRLFRME